MKKTFCDKCGDEIKVDSEYVFGKELCPVCAEIISDWLEGKTLELGHKTEDKPIITDPECCGDCYKCMHFHTHGDPVERKAIVACRHYKKRLYFELGDIMVGSVTPLTFKDYGEEMYPNCHGYSEEELE